MMKRSVYLGLSMVVASLIIFLENAEALPYAVAYQRTIKLCSKNLSDALYLVCLDRGGYNEPFSYSGEVEIQTSTGPGIVEECCFSSCSYEHLQQYCKPLDENKNNSSDDSQDEIEESLRIVNFPYTSPRKQATDRRPVAIGKSDNEGGKSKKSNLAKMKKGDGANWKARKHAEKVFKGNKKRKGDNKRRNFEARKNESSYDMKKNIRYSNVEKADFKINSKRVSRRRKRPKHPSRIKIQRETEIPVVPEFKVGTTIPDPKDFILFLFPSRTNLLVQRAAKDLADSLDFEKFN